MSKNSQLRWSGKKRVPPESLLGRGSPGVRLEEDAAHSPKLREEQGRLAHVHALHRAMLEGSVADPAFHYDVDTDPTFQFDPNLFTLFSLRIGPSYPSK
jgi:hypothetical protein